MLQRFLPILVALVAASQARANPRPFFENHCLKCHDADTKKGGLDLGALKLDADDPESVLRWVKIFDRVDTGEMPPGQKKPDAKAKGDFLAGLKKSIIEAERTKLAGQGRTGVRRLTKAEYENTMRDLFELHGILLQNELPADGSAHGFDNNSDALDISHVNLTKYLEAADRTLDVAIATRPTAPKVETAKISLGNPAGFVAHVVLQGDGILLKNKQIDPDFPPAGAHAHIDESAHARMQVFHTGTSVGLFRHEDESFHPYFNDFVTLYPGMYRLKTSFWSFQWDKGKVLPSRGVEAGRLSVVQMSGDGRGGGHPSTVIGYYDAPSLDEKVHEFKTWLNFRETIGFNAASLAPHAPTRGKNRTMGYTGPGIACDYFEIEGPFNDVWPPRSHRLLFGDLPLVEIKKETHPDLKFPRRKLLKQEVGSAKNRPELVPGIWTVQSDNPVSDADRLLASFLPKAFRRPVDAETRKLYLAKFEERFKTGECFENAMRWVYRAALCSPDFLYHIEPAGKLDDHSLASRLSYFFWRSMPDTQLIDLAAAGKLHEPTILREQIERLLKHPRSQRFVEDFLGQWLKLRLIAATDPDRKLYPEFSPYLQDSMVGETRAYFREMLEQNLGATYLVKSDFAMLNERLAVHYGIEGVTGSQVRKVPLPADSPRGGFLTHASILKITANGTTTSPVPRGAFVMDRILGVPPEPPPPNVPAIEPDVRGAKTIREQLDKHRNDATCASCHRKMDPPGFALESFDVLGSYRTRYRTIGQGDPAPRGSIDPRIGISFLLGPKVDASGELVDGRSFNTIQEFQTLLASNPEPLLKNLARQFAIYGTGRNVNFGDRDEIAQIVASAQKQGGGIRTLIHELMQSQLFQTR